MAEENLTQSIKDLLNADQFDLEKAADIYLKYGPNKNMARHFVRNPRRYERKLRWQLAKMIGISLEEFTASNSSESKSKTGGHPEIIDKIKDEIARLTNDQAELQKELSALGDDNDEQTKDRAVELGKAIDVTAYRLDDLHKAKEKYFEEGVIPSEENLFPDQKSGNDQDDPFGISKMKPADLMKRRSNLVSSITKDQNRLKYQADKKQDKENPMPEGEKRQKTEERLAKKNEELKAIDEFLNENQ